MSGSILLENFQKSDLALLILNQWFFENLPAMEKSDTPEGAAAMEKEIKVVADLIEVPAETMKGVMAKARVLQVFLDDREPDMPGALALSLLNDLFNVNGSV